jgi:hypothetical protein
LWSGGNSVARDRRFREGGQKEAKVMKLLSAFLAARIAMPSTLLGLIAYRPTYLQVLDKLDALAATLQRMERRLDKIDDHLGVDTRPDQS